MRIFKYLLRVFPSPPEYGHNRIHRRTLNLQDLPYFSSGRAHSRGNSFSNRGRSKSSGTPTPTTTMSSNTATLRDASSSSRGDGASTAAQDGAGSVGDGSGSQQRPVSRGLLIGHEGMSLRQIVLEYLQKDVGTDGTTHLKTFGDSDAGQRRVLYRCNNDSNGGPGITISVLIPLEELKEHPERSRQVKVHIF